MSYAPFRHGRNYGVPPLGNLNDDNFPESQIIREQRSCLERLKERKRTLLQKLTESKKNPLTPPWYDKMDKIDGFLYTSCTLRHENKNKIYVATCPGSFTLSVTVDDGGAIEALSISVVHSSALEEVREDLERSCSECCPSRIVTMIRHFHQLNKFRNQILSELFPSGSCFRVYKPEDTTGGVNDPRRLTIRIRLRGKPVLDLGWTFELTNEFQTLTHKFIKLPPVKGLPDPKVVIPEEVSKFSNKLVEEKYSLENGEELRKLMEDFCQWVSAQSKAK